MVIFSSIIIILLIKLISNIYIYFFSLKNVEFSDSQLFFLKPTLIFMEE